MVRILLPIATRTKFEPDGVSDTGSNPVRGTTKDLLLLRRQKVGSSILPFATNPHTQAIE